MEKVLNHIIEKLKEYKETTNCRGVVLGISGGKDSTTVAMLAKKVWGDNVFGVLMPNGEQRDLEDSKAIVRALNIKYKVINIASIYSSMLSKIEFPEHEKTIIVSEKAKTNIPPRIRMTVLYAIAQSLGYRVIGTGNASEAYIGWTTKFGDSACDINPIGGLTCSEVIALGKLLVDEFCLDKKFIEKTPDDGLSGRSDEENFGFTYRQLDDYILSGTSGDKEVDEKIEKMHKASEHKRNMPKII